MIAAADCRRTAECLYDYLGNALPAAERSELENHLRACASCREAVARIREVQTLLAGARAAEAPSRDFAERTGERFTTGVAPFVAPLPADEPAPAAGRNRLAKALGAMPWWTVSGAFHALLLLLVTLIGAALGRAQDDTVIVTDLARRPPEEQKIEPVTRDIFRNPVPLETAQVVVEQQMVEVRDEVEVADHAETVNDSELNSARGEESAIADVPLGGQGVFASIGLGGGGGGAFGQRVGGGRRRLALQHGGGQKTEAAVDAGLAWLARNQEPDGRWDSKKFGGAQGMWEAKPGDAARTVDVAVTGMALLAFLGAGHTEKVGKYKENVRNAIDWVIAQQADTGTIGHDGGGYGHAIAGMALSEAAAMGRIERTKAAAQKAVDRTCGAGTKWEEQSERGGWGYAPYQLSTVTGDISNSGWHMMFVKSAKVAGLQVNPASLEGILKYLDAVERGKKEGDPYSGHRYVYTPQDDISQVRPTRCSIGLLCRQFFGTPPEELADGVNHMLETGKLPHSGLKADGAWQDGAGVNLYYCYYGTLVCFQQGGEVWKNWNEALKKALPPTQIKDGGPNDGSWDPRGTNADHWGRVGQTALSILCLEVYYRYLPLYR
ncbi:MAG: zf-HC2 domain-containing protein [Planctomycetota bacterium]|nr:zf-HC2 domain-containing protein [Planctomycetota bacterium]